MRTARQLLACVAAAASASCAHYPPRVARAPYQAQPNAAALGQASNLGLFPAVVYQNGTGTASYQAATLADLPRNAKVHEVQGRACESGLQVPWGLLTQPVGPALDALWASVGWGDSGYQKALREAAGQVAPDALLYDVRADLQTVNVLGIWRQACVLVTASAVTRLPDPPAYLAPSEGDGADGTAAATPAAGATPAAAAPAPSATPAAQAAKKAAPTPAAAAPRSTPALAGKPAAPANDPAQTTP